MQRSADMVFPHHSDLEPSRRMVDLLHEGMLRRRRRVGIARFRAGGAVEHDSAIAHPATYHVSSRHPAPTLTNIGPERHASARGLETEQPTLCCWNADRAPAISRMSNR